MTIRGIQRGQQSVPGLLPTDATADAQASEGATAEFSALLSQMASQVGTSVPDSAGATLMNTLKATVATRQDAKAAEPARPRADRDRPEWAEPAARSADKAARRDDRADAEDAAPAEQAADVPATNNTPAVDPAAAQAAVPVAPAAPVVTDAAAAAAAAAVTDQAVVPEQAAAAQAVQAQTQTVSQDAKAAGPAQQGPAQPGRGARDEAQTQTAQAVQAVSDGQQQAQSGLTDDGAAGQDPSANRSPLADHQAKAAKTALSAEQAATNAGAAAEAARPAEGPLTTVNAEQSKGLAKAIGDDRPVSVQVQTDTAVRQPVVQADDAGDAGPASWYDLAKQGPQAPANGTAASAPFTDGAQQQQPLLGLSAIAAAASPAGAANSAVTASAAEGVSGVDGVKGTSGTGQTGATSAPAAAQSASGPQHAQQAAKAQAAKATARPQAAEEQDPVEQIRVRIQQDATKGETIKIALRPDNLGKVEVKLDIRDGKVNAQVVAETSETLEMMKTDVKGLEKALNDAGLRADPGSVTFSLKDGGTQQQMAQQDQGQNGRQGPGTPYDSVGHSLEDDLSPEIGTIDAMRSAQAAARGGVDVRI